MNRTIAAVVAAALLTAVAGFQFALAQGAPIDDAVLGGRAHTDHGVLTTGYRAIAGFMVLNSLGNLSSDHPFERWVLGAITVVAATLATVVARHPRPVVTFHTVPEETQVR